MGKLTQGRNGGFSGKAGSFVGYNLNGQWLIRGLPKLSAKNKKGSEKQNFYRSGMKQFNDFFGPLRDFVIEGFSLEAKERNMTPYNCAKSWNLKNAFNEANELDYSLVRLTSGRLPNVSEASVTADENGIHFVWADDSGKAAVAGDPKPDKFDEVMLVAYVVKTREVLHSDVMTRRFMGAETLSISQGLDKDWHCWISLVSNKHDEMSVSKYLGVVRY